MALTLTMTHTIPYAYQLATVQALGDRCSRCRITKELDEEYFWGGDWDVLLGALPNVSHLSLSNSFSGQPAAPVSLSFMENLKYLHIHVTDDTEELLRDGLPASLEVLVIECLGPLPCFPRVDNDNLALYVLGHPYDARTTGGLRAPEAPGRR